MESNSSNGPTSQTPSVIELESITEYKASVFIWKFVPPILILLGTAGNTLSILTLRRKSIRSSTTALYLTVLAFSDLTVLHTGLLRQWLRYAFAVDVRAISEIGCKIHIWLVYSSLDCSAWILVVLTIERVVSVWLPHRAKGLCTKFTAAVSLILIGVFVLSLNSHLLYGKGNVVNADTIDKCDAINESYYQFFNKIWPWIDLCVYSLVPCTVIIVGNSLILVKIIKSRNKIRSRARSAGARRNRAPNRNTSSMTAVLFTLNIFFLISTTPISAYNIGYAYWVNINDLERVARLDLWWAIVNMFMYSNNTFNFILYCFIGSKFRQEVIKMICRAEETTTENVSLQLSNLRRTDNTCVN
ncbi:hypothetical protein ACF0H5_012712 [Mactra antiquata]